MLRQSASAYIPMCACHKKIPQSRALKANIKIIPHKARTALQNPSTQSVSMDYLQSYTSTCGKKLCGKQVKKHSDTLTRISRIIEANTAFHCYVSIHLSLHAFLNSAQEEGEWSASRCGLFPQGE
jgi:hypothetical protein